MKYWLLTSEFPPVYGGGISTYCLETAKMLVSNKHEVIVFTPDLTVNETNEIQDKGFKVIRFNPGKYYTSSFLGYEANLSYAFSQIVQQYIEKQGTPDVIEAQEYMGIAYYLLQFKHLGYLVFKDLKVLITLHAPSFLYLEYNKVIYHRLPYFWVGEMEKFCIRAADQLISPSKYLVDEIKKRIDVSGLNIHILQNPYCVNWNRPEQVIQKNKIVFFGKLIPQKGCLELIADFKQLWIGGFKHPLLMIGGGNHLYHPEGMDMIDFIRKKYRKEIRQGLLCLLGAIRPEELNRHLLDAHIIVIPSLVDNLPYTVLEAMGRGKIVLASVQGGQAEVIENNVDGFLFDHEQHGSFQQQLQKIVELNDDEMNAISKQAYDKIKSRYSYSTVYEQKLVLLQELMTKKTEQEIFPFIRPTQAKQSITINTKEKTPLLSVVIPYYNMEKYVEETLVSLRCSEHKNMEIIIVNDGSDEKESKEVLSRLESKYTLKIIHQQNQGLAIARNNGALQASGDYLAFLDPDDTVEPAYYSKALQVLMNRTNVYFVGCWAKYFGESEKYWPTFNPEPPFLLVHNTVNSSALVYKKQAFLQAGLNDARMLYGMEDYEGVINMVKQGFQGVVLPEALWNYRLRRNSMARAFTVDKQLYLYRLISEKHADFYATFAADIFNLLNANGPGINYDNPTVFYNLPGTGFIGQKVKQALITTIKSNALLRKAALKIKRHL